MAVTLIVAPPLGAGTLNGVAARAQHTVHPRRPAASEPSNQTAVRAGAAIEQELKTLSRELRDSSRVVAGRAYLRLAALSRRWPSVERDRAALALGYYEYQRARYAEARRWFRAARGDPVLARYALYWDGMAAAAASQDADAIALLGEFRRQFPGSAVDKPALETYADAAIDAKEPDLALTAIRAYPHAGNSPDLLVRLAFAEEQAGDRTAAALDFQRVYNQFPLADAANTAERAIERLRVVLGDGFPEAPLADRVLRAKTLYAAGRWRKAERAWEPLLDSLPGTEREEAALRVAQCESRLTHNPGALETLTLTDPTLNAERWISLFNVYWDRNDEDQMKAAVDKVVQLSAAGAPAEMANRALFMMGNYYWANMQWDQAVAYYHQIVARQPDSPEALTADWRIAWTAYIENDSDAGVLLSSHIQKFPDSPYVPDALYWLGRLAETAGNPSLARLYYTEDSSRFAETYFGRLAGERASKITAQVDPPADAPLALFARIAPLQPMLSLDDDIPDTVRGRYERAMALESIAFDDTAMLELRDAYRVSQAPQLLIDAAQAAQADKRYLTGAALVRQLAPDLESRPMDSVPILIWRIVYPLPLKSLIESTAGRYHFDPMLYASLIRQESGFQPDALSSAGAVGLAQLEPFTARKWSRVLHLWYSPRRLVDPRYNLSVSGVYLQSLITMFGSVEEAVAAYNAGEDRVASWLDSHHYDEPAEFVESIPFTQTRDYVEVVMNGAAIYRRLYENRP